MKKSGYILVLWLLFLAVAKLLDAVGFWHFVGLERPHGYVVQGSIFIAVLFVLQNFLFEPYLRVLNEREAQTTGKVALAEKTRLDAEGRLKEYRQKIEETWLQATRQREHEGLKADEEEQTKIAEAKDLAKRNLQTAVNQIQKESNSARDQLQASIETVTEEIVSNVLAAGGSRQKARSASGKFTEMNRS
jgi:F0F1-type ATP synthase membrane subunit b/b'